ncbi:hypothetical protein [Egbenema bharatensis]|uniref:hypothetical protein n=1 Tax=Egbenema bharatensis TaxID=3463334 RepID=UPI003A8B73DE
MKTIKLQTKEGAWVEINPKAICVIEQKEGRFQKDCEIKTIDGGIYRVRPSEADQLKPAHTDDTQLTDQRFERGSLRDYPYFRNLPGWKDPT